MSNHECGGLSELREEVREMHEQGFRRIRPEAYDEWAGIDSAIVSATPCGDCGGRCNLMAYQRPPWVAPHAEAKPEYVGEAYRAIAVCLNCGEWGDI